MDHTELEPVEQVRVTILMDNVTDPLISDAGPVSRLSWPKALAESAAHVPVRFAADPGVPDALIAEAGFSALVRVEKNGRERTLLFDTGVSPTGMVENMRRLGLSLQDVEVIVLSHGHWDHVSVLITGEVDRTTEFETGFRGHEALGGGGWQADPLILDDQALVLRLSDRGLVVLSGCGHAGIVNTVHYAQKLTGTREIAAIIGGFHLSGPMFETIVAPTVRAFDELSAGLLVPAHCTGWKAVHQLAARFPDAFVQSAVGTTIEL